MWTNSSSAPSPRPSASSISARSSSVELGGLGLELHAHAQHLGPAGQLVLDRLDDRRDVVELVLADVDDRQHRPVGQQEVRAQQRPHVGVEVAAVQGRALGQHRLGGVERGDLVGQRPVGLGRLAPLGHLVLDGLEVGERQLELDDAQVLERVGRARARRRRRTPAARTRRRRPRGCWPGTGCPGPRPCSPPRPGRRCRRTAPLAGTTLRLADIVGQRVEPVVEHLRHPDVGVAGGERVGRGQRTAAGQRVVQRRLAGIGETDEPEPFHPGRLTIADRPTAGPPSCRSPGQRPGTRPRACSVSPTGERNGAAARSDRGDGAGDRGAGHRRGAGAARPGEPPGRGDGRPEVAGRGLRGPRRRRGQGRLRVPRHANAVGRTTVASLWVQPRTRWHRGEDIRTGLAGQPHQLVEIVVLDALGADHVRDRRGRRRRRGPALVDGLDQHRLRPGPSRRGRRRPPSGRGLRRRAGPRARARRPGWPNRACARDQPAGGRRAR